MTNPYGPGPYGQSNPTDPQQQHDLYGSMTGYSSAQSSSTASDPYAPAPQSGYGTHENPYQTPNPYGTQQDPSAAVVNPYAAYGGSQPAAPAARKSSVLGIIAMIIAALGGVASMIVAVAGGRAFVTIVDTLGTSTIPEVPPVGLESQYMTFGLTVIFAPLTALPILVGLIMGIVAIAKNRGRVPGIVATILAVLLPIIAFVIFFVIVGPAAMQNVPS